MKQQALAITTALCAAFGTLVLVSMDGEARTGAGATLTPSQECSRTGRDNYGADQFLPNCAGSSVSPNKDWTVALTPAADGKGAPTIVARDGKGQLVGRITALENDKPFAIRWAPQSGRFLASEFIEGQLTRPRLFDIGSTGITERPDPMPAAWAQAQQLNQCLPNRMADMPGANAYVFGWSRDGKTIGLVVEAGNRPCDRSQGVARHVAMISDVETGAVVPGSARLMEYKVDGGSQVSYFLPENSQYRGIH